MSKNQKLVVQGHEITISQINDKDYISLTDIVSALEGGRMVISNWLSRKDTVQYLALWESLYNPNFNFTEFGEITKDAGKNSFTLSPKKWIEGTNAIGIATKYGGGTLAHKEIALDFCSWLSPSFRLYLNKEFDRLKEIEGSQQNIEWNIKRVLSKTNYHIHTAAVQNYRIPIENLPKEKEGIIYADEAEILNYSVFGYSSKTWKQENPDLVLKGMNLRDVASINELIVLTNMESINSVMLASGMNRQDRMRELRNIAQGQLKAINKIDIEKSYKRTLDGGFQPVAPKQLPPLSDFNTKLNTALNYNPKDDKDKAPE